MGMENISESLQQFLDGSLSGDQEAELLHRLSVSPERREVLRSYMKQSTIISADRSAIVVPYSAEQKLWAAIGAMSPVVSGVPVATTVATSTGLLASSVWKMSAVAVVAILMGLGSGYLLWSGNNSSQLSTSPDSQIKQSLSENVGQNTVAPTSTNIVGGKSQVFNSLKSARSENIIRQSIGAPLQETPQLANGTDLSVDLLPVLFDRERVNQIPEASPLLASGSFIRDPNAPQREHPSIGGAMQTHSPRFLERFDFAIHEGIGKQFPNTAATNTSMPIITNSDISVKYQLTPEFWIGASFGTANVTQKKLSTTFVDPNAPLLQYQVVSDLVHEQTVWGGGLIEYRKPISTRFTFAANVGLAASTLGPIISSELGVRYDVTGDVGVLLGLRGSRINSNVAKQYQDIITSSSFNAGTGVAPGVTDDKANLNVEISTGIYFHF